MTTFLDRGAFMEPWEVPGAILGAPFPRDEVERDHGDKDPLPERDVKRMGQGAIDMSRGSFGDRDAEITEALLVQRRRFAAHFGQSALAASN